jgi:predicted anti-sigma-YlaC factor YlaD
MIEWIVGSTVAGATYLYAKRKKKASTGKSAAAAAAGGAASYGATLAVIMAIAAVWPLFVVGALAGGYYLGKKRPKALPAAPEG